MSTLIRVAVCVALNDASTPAMVCKPLQSPSMKTSMTWIEMYVMMVQTIRDKWINPAYVFTHHVFHTHPLSPFATHVLEALGDIHVHHMPCDNTAYNRPLIYQTEIECDYRFVLDCDTLAVDDLDFNLQEMPAVMGMLGGEGLWPHRVQQLCTQLGLKQPKEPLLFPAKPRSTNPYYPEWSGREMVHYHYNVLNTRPFPYFNNGAIVVRNDIAKELGVAWYRARAQCAKKRLTTHNGQENIGLAGQLTIGLCINHVTDDWGVLPRGFNLAIGTLTKRLAAYPGKKYLVHYIALDHQSVFFQQHILSPYQNMWTFMQQCIATYQ